jgi:hypothetical protein
LQTRPKQIASFSKWRLAEGICIRIKTVHNDGQNIWCLFVQAASNRKLILAEAKAVFQLFTPCSPRRLPRRFYRAP